MKWTLPLSLIVQMTSNLLSWDFFQTKVTFKLCKIADTKVHIIWREAEKHLTRLCPGEPSLIYVHFQCRLRLQPGFLVGVCEICSCTRVQVDAGVYPSSIVLLAKHEPDTDV